MAVVVTFSALPPGARKLLSALGLDAPAFPAYVQRSRVETVQRERDGENDHLIFYILQSRRFTKAPPMEPALSAQAFAATETIGAAELARFRDFLRAPALGERMIYLRGLLPAVSPLQYLEAEYRRVARGIYAKEFAGKADFYETRGHSTDTQVPANYAVWNALSVLHGIDPAFHPRRILIAGPGLDFAPRTGLDERYPPQSYQPYAVADALIGLGLAEEPRIHCVDINARVLGFFREFPARRRPVLRLFTPPGDEDYAAYFRQLGHHLGDVTAISPLEKEIRLAQDIAQSVTAEKLDIVTEHLPDQYDLAIATNILVYFHGPDLLLALANLQAMLAPGAYLIHNDLRPEIDGFAAAAGLKPIQARTVKVARGQKAPLFDAFAIHQK